MQTLYTRVFNIHFGLIIIVTVIGNKGFFFYSRIQLIRGLREKISFASGYNYFTWSEGLHDPKIQSVISNILVYKHALANLHSKEKLNGFSFTSLLVSQMKLISTKI